MRLGLVGLRRDLMGLRLGVNLWLPVLSSFMRVSGCPQLPFGLAHITCCVVSAYSYAMASGGKVILSVNALTSEPPPLGAARASHCMKLII